MTAFKQKWLLIALGSIWLISIITGLAILARHENSAGPAATPPVIWPTDSKVIRSKDQLTLIMFGHPKCPCTRASIGELALLMARCQKRLTAHVLFIKPAGTPEDWEKTDLWRSAEIIPGVSVQTDWNGVEANRFNAVTSGQTVLYDLDGKLLFQGGITVSRGHSGDNAGRSTIMEIVERLAPKSEQIKEADRPKAEKVSTAVFGCSLCRTEDNDQSDTKSGGEGRE